MASGLSFDGNLGVPIMSAVTVNSAMQVVVRGLAPGLNQAQTQNMIVEVIAAKGQWQVLPAIERELEFQDGLVKIIPQNGPNRSICCP
jgi:hypothetical protein